MVTFCFSSCVISLLFSVRPLLCYYFTSNAAANATTAASNITTTAANATTAAANATTAAANVTHIFCLFLFLLQYQDSC